MWLLYLLGIAILLLILIILKQYSYWSKRGVDTPKYKYLFGNLWEQFIMKKNFGIIVADAYNEFKDYNYIGFYNSTSPAIVLRNPEAIGDILIKDFASFADNDCEVDPDKDPILGRSPFILSGNKWKAARAQLTPSFTTGKVKIMLSFLKQNNKRLLEYLEKNEKVPMNAKVLAMRITSENVATCAFGLDGGSFSDKAKFMEVAHDLFTPTWYNTMRAILIFLVPQLSLIFKLRFFHQGAIDFLRSIIIQTMSYRKENQVRRNDFLDAMADIKDKINDEKVFNFEDILARAGGFFLEGIETSSAVISHALYELATHPDIQEKLRQEIMGVTSIYKGDYTYEAMQEMEYLDFVHKENLRKNPPLLFMTRRVTKPYIMGSMREDHTGPHLALEVGTPVIVPIYALHHDEKYFPDEKSFIPERFSAENKDSITNNTYLPFGDGPRVCLGMKFGVLQTKVALITILSNYKITVNSKTQEPIQIDPQNFVHGPVGGYWLEFSKLQN